MSRAAALAVVLIGVGAAAAPPGPPGRGPVPTPTVVDPAARLAAVAGGDDARAAILVGPAGQIYSPDGHGAWLRTHAGGVGDAVVVATRTDAGVLAGADGAPPYRFDGSAWEAIYLAMHAKAVVARGRRPVAAVGRQVFALDRAEPQRLPDAPGAVTAIGASAAGVAIATDRGVARLDGKAWRTLDGAPRRVVALASERWAIGVDGATDLASSTTTAWPRGVEVTAFVAADDGLLAAAATPSGVDLFSIHAGKLAREAVPVAPSGTPVGLATDKDHRVVLALRDGRVLVRDHDKWTTIEVRDELPVAKPGAGAATAK